MDRPRQGNSLLKSNRQKLSSTRKISSQDKLKAAFLTTHSCASVAISITTGLRRCLFFPVSNRRLRIWVHWNAIALVKTQGVMRSQAGRKSLNMDMTRILLSPTQKCSQKLALSATICKKSLSPPIVIKYKRCSCKTLRCCYQFPVQT